MSFKKNKVSILTTSDYPYYGAPESFVRQMSLGLFKNNADVEVIRFWGDRYSNYNNTQIKCSNYLFKNPVQNEFLKFFELFFQIIYVPFFIYKRKFIDKDDSIILYGLDRLYIVAPILIFCKLMSLKCFRVITEIYLPQSYITAWWRKPLLFFNNAQRKIIDRYLDGIVVLSKFLYRECIKNNVEESKIIVIPHFIDLNNREWNGNVQTADGFLVGYCGSCTLENGITDLVKAHRIVTVNRGTKNIKLVIIGYVPQEILEEIREINIDYENIIFKGHLNPKDVFVELNKCSILVNPRRKTILSDSGFPTKLGEYFSTKKPVITTKLGDLIDYFEDNNHVVFATPSSAESIALRILFLYENGDVAEKIGIQGHLWAKDNLDYINNSRRLLDFINSNHS